MLSRCRQRHPSPPRNSQASDKKSSFDAGGRRVSPKAHSNRAEVEQWVICDGGNCGLVVSVRTSFPRSALAGSAALECGVHVSPQTFFDRESSFPEKISVSAGRLWGYCGESFLISAQPNTVARSGYKWDV